MKRKVTLLILGIVLVILGTLFYLVRDTGEIYSNVSVSGIDLSNKTKGEALSLVNGIKIENIKLKYENKDYTIPAANIAYKVNSEKTIDEAYKIGRDNSFIKNKMRVLKLKVLGEKAEVPVAYTKDNKALKSELEKISSSINVKEKDAKIIFNGDQVSISNEENGKKLNVEKSMKLVEDELK